MGDSTHTYVTQDVVDKIFEEDVDMARMIVKFKRELNDGFYDKKWVDLFVQKPERFSRFDIYDAFAFMHLWTDFWHGKIGLFHLVCGYPSSDSDVDGNQNKLNGLEHPFEARFSPQRGGRANDDGYVAWSEPIVLTATNHVPDYLESGVFQIKAKPDQLPLEVGTTLGSRTRLHFALEGGVARWPYGHDRITLMVALSPPRSAFDKHEPTNIRPPTS